eukprot:76609_1
MSTAVKDARLCLKVGSKCRIYSRSSKKWYDGTVDKIIIDSKTNKEWLTIKYCHKRKQMQRFCKDLKLLPNNRRNIIKNTNTKNQSISIDFTQTNTRPPRTNLNQFNSLQPRHTTQNTNNNLYTIDYDRIMRMKLPSNNTLKYGWISLVCADFPILPASNLIPINKTEFAIATEFSFYPPFGGIYKYNTRINKWNILMEYPSNIPFAKGCSFSLTFNAITNELFLYGTQIEPHSKHALLAKIDITQMKYNLILIPRNYSIPIEASAVIINKQYHVIGGQGRHNSTHSILNIENNKCINGNYRFRSAFKLWRSGAIPYGLIAVKSQNKLIAFGDCAPKSRRYKNSADEIWEYCIDSKNWNVMNSVKLPCEMINFGYILTSDEKYILIFGGVCTTEKELIDFGVSVRKRLDSIYILDLETLIFYISDIGCPMVGDFDTVLMSSVCMNGAVDLVNGYIKRIENNIWIPLDIVNLISFYCRNEYVHLMQRKEIFAKHWKICIDDILNGMR